MLTFLELRALMEKALDRCISCWARCGLTLHEIANHLEERVRKIRSDENTLREGRNRRAGGRP